MKFKTSLKIALFSVMVPVTFEAVTKSPIAFAHETTFPTRQLAALTPKGERLTFKENDRRPNAKSIEEFQKKYALSAFTRGELLGNYYLGRASDGKVRLVAVFLDGSTSRGETEFGAAVDTSGKLASIRVFSTPETNDATTDAFLSGLLGKTADELAEFRKSIPESEKSKLFISELALKAIGRVEAGFPRK